MIVSLKNGSFVAGPEYVGRGVIVDCTPLKRQPTPFGEREVFKAVVEVDSLRADGTRRIGGITGRGR